MKTYIKNGFTIVEVLIVMAILGIVLTSGTAVFISTITTSNKIQTQDTVKEAGRNASELITRRIQAAKAVTVVTGSLGTQVDVVDGDGVTTRLSCVNGIGDVNGELKIGTTALTFQGNGDNTKGVNVTYCNFVVVGGAGGKAPPALQYSFTVSQAVGSPPRPEYQASIDIKSTVVSRSYEF